MLIIPIHSMYIYICVYTWYTRVKLNYTNIVNKKNILYKIKLTGSVIQWFERVEGYPEGKTTMSWPHAEHPKKPLLRALVERNPVGKKALGRPWGGFRLKKQPIGVQGRTEACVYDTGWSQKPNKPKKKN